MVGFVNAGDVGQATQAAGIDGGITVYVGTWEASTSQCIPVSASDCLKIGISIDFNWLKQLFN